MTEENAVTDETQEKMVTVTREKQYKAFKRMALHRKFQFLFNTLMDIKDGTDQVKSEVAEVESETPPPATNPFTYR